MSLDRVTEVNTSSGEEDDSDEHGRQTYDFGHPPGWEHEWKGSGIRRWKEDPRHIAWLQTGCNLSHVLSLIYQIGGGISYYKMRHYIKCGIHAKTQIRRPFETLLKMGFYDNIERFTPKRAVVLNSLPTAESCSDDPDGPLQAMRDLHWFSPGGRLEHWSRVFLPCCNVDTGLTEPLRKPVPQRTVHGEPMFKTVFKCYASNWTNRRKCNLCYDSLNEAFLRMRDWVAKAREVDAGGSLRARLGMDGGNDGGQGAGEGMQVAHANTKPQWIVDLAMVITSVAKSIEWERFYTDRYKYDDDRSKLLSQYSTWLDSFTAVRSHSWADEDDEGSLNDLRYDHRDIPAAVSKQVDTMKQFFDALDAGNFHLLTIHMVYYSEEGSTFFSKSNLIASAHNLFMSLRKVNVDFPAPVKIEEPLPSAPQPKEMNQNALVVFQGTDVFGQDIPEMTAFEAPEYELDTFFHSLKKCILFFVDSGYELDDYLIYKDVKNMNTEAWSGMARERLCRFLNDYLLREIVKFYFLPLRDPSTIPSEPQTEIPQREIEAYKSKLLEFKDNVKMYVEQWILQIIADYYNVKISIFFMDFKENYDDDIPLKNEITPSKKRVPWETPREFSERSAKKVLAVKMGYIKGAGVYDALIDTVANNMFLIGNDGESMQSNILEMLSKSLVVPFHNHVRIQVNDVKFPKMVDVNLKIKAENYFWMSDPDELKTKEELTNFKVKALIKYISSVQVKIVLQIHIQRDVFNQEMQKSFEEMMSAMLSADAFKFEYMYTHDGGVQNNEENKGIRNTQWGGWTLGHNPFKDDGKKNDEQPEEAIPRPSSPMFPNGREGFYLTSISARISSRAEANNLIQNLTQSLINTRKGNYTNQEGSHVWKKVKIALISKEMLDDFMFDETPPEWLVERVKNLRSTVGKNLEGYGFDSMSLKDDTVIGRYDNSLLFSTYETLIRQTKNHRSWTRGAVFDYLSFPKSTSAFDKYTYDIVGLTFEVLHLEMSEILERHPIHMYIKCIWMALFSLALQEGTWGASTLEENQNLALRYSYSRLHTPETMERFIQVCLTCDRWKSNADAKSLLFILQKPLAETRDMPITNDHKFIMATILNLNITELEMDPNMMLSQDKSTFRMVYRNSFPSRDTFYLSNKDKKHPSLNDECSQFIVRKDISVRFLPTERIIITNTVLPEMNTKNWKADEAADFFQCMATSFVQGGLKPVKMLFDSVEDARNHFIDILNVVYSAYLKGAEAASEGAVVKVNVEFFKIVQLIKSIITYHWKIMKVSPFGTNLPELPPAQIRIELWNQFLSFMETDTYSPGPFELQILANHYNIRVCVVNMSVPDMCVPYESTIHGKRVQWNFMVSDLTVPTWVLGKNHAIAKANEFIVIYENTKNDSYYPRHFVGEKHVTNPRNTAVCDRECALNNSRLVLNLPTTFYDAIPAYFEKLRQIRYSNVFKFGRRLQPDTWESILNSFQHATANKFEELVKKLRDSGKNPDFERDFHVELNSIVGFLLNAFAQEPMKKDVISILNTHMQPLRDELYGSVRALYADEQVPDDVSTMMESYFSPLSPRNIDSLHIRRLIMLDDLKYEDVPIPDLSISRSDIAAMMKEILGSMSEKEQIKVLRHHHKGEWGGINKEAKAELIKSRWDDYFHKGQFVNYLPSPLEMEKLSHRLNLRVLLYYCKWGDSDATSFGDLGNLFNIHDFGPDKTTGLPLVFTGREGCYVLEFAQNLTNRADYTQIVMQIAQYDTFNFNYKYNKSKWDYLSQHGTTDPPKHDIVYKICCLNPSISTQDALKISQSLFKRRCYFFTHPDKRPANRFPSDVFTEYGPESFEDADRLFNFFAKDSGISLTNVCRVCWAFLCDPMHRYIYHYFGLLPPRSKWQYEFNPPITGDAPAQALGKEIIADWSHTSDEQSLQFWTKLASAKVRPFQISILMKGRSPENQHGIYTTEERPMQFSSLVLPNSLRNRTVEDFKKRFLPDSGATGGAKQSQQVWYAPLVSIKKMIDLKVEGSMIKAYTNLHHETNMPDVTRIVKMKFCTPMDFNDFYSGAVKLPDAKRDNDWMKEWAGLKWCIQGAFYNARHDKDCRKCVLDMQGSQVLAWVDEFFGRPDFDWRKNMWDQGRAELNDVYPEWFVCHIGAINPFNIKFETVTGLLNLFYVFYRGEQVMHDRQMRDIVLDMHKRMFGNGEWSSDDKIDSSFDRLRGDEKMKRSIDLMRILGILFNIEFFIMEPFPENDINSLKLQLPGGYFYRLVWNKNSSSMKDGGIHLENHSYFYSLRFCSIGKKGLAWARNKTRRDNYKRFDTLPVEEGVDQLRVFVVWKNDRWHLLKPVEAIDTAFESKMRKEERDRRDEARRKAQNNNKKGHGGDWKGEKQKQPSQPDPQAPPASSSVVPSPGGGGGYAHGSEDDFCDNNDDDDEEGDEGDDGEDEPPDDDDDDDDDDGFYHSRGRFMDFFGYGGNEDEPEYNKQLDRYIRGAFSLSFKTKESYQLETMRGSAVERRLRTFNEDQKEIHFISQKVPMSVCTLRHLAPYSYSNYKIQIGQTEQSKMLAWIVACCFDHARVIPMKQCFTTRFVVACQGLRVDRVRYFMVDKLLQHCFSLDAGRFREVCDMLYAAEILPRARMDALRQEIQYASDELWADDFRVSLIMARTYIQAALEGVVRPDPNYLSPELAGILNREVISRVSPQDRARNIQMIRELMRSDFAGQLLPLFRVVFHPDLHTWKTVLPSRVVRRQEKKKGSGGREYWNWEDACILCAGSETSTPLRFRRVLQLC